MFSWSLRLFQVRGIQVAVHWSFFLLVAYVGGVGWQPDPAEPLFGGWTGVLLNVGILLAFFTCVVLHEFGHSFAAMAYGIRVRRILVMPIGGMAEFDSIPREPHRELLITLAGPAVNFALAALLWLLMPRGAGHLDTATGVVLEILLQWNILMGVFNLVPVFPMDGGRILRALLATRLPHLRATRIAAAVAKVLGLAAIAAALFAPELGLAESPAYLVALLFTFILFAGEMEYRAAVRRAAEEEHWRQLYARFHQLRSRYDDPLDEPPLLSR